MYTSDHCKLGSILDGIYSASSWSKTATHIMFLPIFVREILESCKKSRLFIFCFFTVQCTCHQSWISFFNGEKKFTHTRNWTIFHVSTNTWFTYRSERYVRRYWNIRMANNAPNVNGVYTIERRYYILHLACAQ